MNENEKNVNTTEETTTPIEETTEATTTEEAVEQMSEEDTIEVFMKMIADNTAAINALTETATKKARKRSIFAKIGIGIGGLALGATAGIALTKYNII